MLAVAQPATIDVVSIQAKAAAGDPEALNTLGNLYTAGAAGVRQDFGEARRAYQRAADKGFAPAQFNLGLAYELGRGTALDERQSFRFYLLAAEQGYPPAQFNVGNMYANGRGVGRDDFEANVWFRQAADQGVVEAQFNLGLAYEGGRGLKKDEAQAARWYRIAAERGFARAQYNLALLCEEGRGVTADDVTAAALYRASALQGFALAQNNLGLFFAAGRGGLPKDMAEAFAWLNLAVEGGASPQARDALAREISPADREKSTRLLAAYRGQLAGGGVPAAVTRPPSADPGQLGEMDELVAKLRSANEQLSLANQRLVSERAQLSEQLARAGSSDQVVQLRADAQRLQQANLQLSAERDSIAAQVAALGQRLQEAEQQLGQLRAKTPAIDPGDVAKLQAGIAELQRQNAGLAADKDAAGAQLASLNDRLAVAARENSRLQAEVASAAKRGPDPEVATLKTQVERVLAENRQLAAQGAAAGNRLAELDGQLKLAEAEIARLRTTATATATADKAVGDLRSQLEMLQGKQGNAEVSIARLQQENARLVGEVTRLETERTAAATAVTATAAAGDPAKLAALLEQREARIRLLERDNERMNDDVKRSTIELLSLNAQIRNIREQGAGESRAGAGSPAADAAAGDALRQENSRLARQAAEFQTQADRLAKENADLKALTETLEKKVTQGSDDAALTELRTAAAATAAQLSEAQLALRQALARNDQLAAEQTAAVQTAAAAEKRLAELGSARREAATQTGAEVQSLTLENQKLQADLRQARSAVDDAGLELRQAQLAAARLEVENQQLLQSQAAAARVVEVLAETRSRLENAESSARALQDQLTVARSANKLLEEGLAAARAQAGSARELVNETEILRKRVAQVDGEIKQLKEAAVDGAELEASRQRVTELNRQLLETAARAQEAERQLAGLKASEAVRVAGLQSALDTASTDAKRLAAEAGDLRGEVARLRTAAGQVESLQAQLAALNDDNRKFKAEAASASQGRAEEQLRLTELNRQLLETTARAQEAERQLAGLKASEAVRIAGLQSALDTASTDAKRLAAEAGDLRGEVARLRTAAGQVESLQAQLAALNDDNRKLKAEAASASEGRAEEQLRLTELNRQLLETTARAQEAERQLAGLKASEAVRIAGLQSALDTASTDAKRLAAEAGDLRSEVARLRTAAGQSESLQAQLAALNDDNRRLKAEVASASEGRAEEQLRLTELGRQLEEARGAGVALARQLQDLQASQLALKEEAAAATADSRRLAAELATAWNNLNERDAGIAALTAGQEKLQQGLLEARQEAAATASLRDEVARLRTEAENVPVLQEKLATLTADQAKLQAALAAAQDRSDEQRRLAALQKQLDEALATSEARAVQLADLQAERSASLAAVANAETTGQEVRAALALSQQTIAEITVENDQLEKNLVLARAELAAANEKLADTSRASLATEALRAELGRLGAENTRLKSTAVDPKALDESRERVVTLTTELEETRRRLAASEQQVAAVAAASVTATDLEQSLRNQLAQETESAAALRSQLADLTGAYGELQADLENANKSTQAALAAQRQAVSAAQPDAYQTEINTLTAQVRKLEQQLEEERGTAAREISNFAAQLQRARETSRSLTEANRALLAARDSETSAVREEQQRSTVLATELNQQLETLKGRNETLAASLAAANGERDGLAAQLAAARRATAGAQEIAAEKAALEARLAEAGSQLTAAQQEIEELKQTHTVLAGRLDEAEKLRDEVRTLRGRLDGAEKAGTAHERSVAELTAENVRLTREREDMRRLVDSYRTDITRLTDAARAAEQQRTLAERAGQQSVDALAVQLAALRRELDAVRQTAVREAEAAVVQDRERQAAIAQLRNENAAQAARLAQAQGTLDQIAAAARLGTPAAQIASGAPAPVPVATPVGQPAATVRYHVVVEGDSLSRISLRYYGTAARWQEIFEANREELRGANTLEVGRQLRIP